MAEHHADLWWAFALVVALFCAVASTSVVACEFGAAGAPIQDHPIAQRLSHLVTSMGGPIEPAARQIMRIHKVE